jgi:hypothetical protein
MLLAGNHWVLSIVKKDALWRVSQKRSLGHLQQECASARTADPGAMRSEWLLSALSDRVANLSTCLNEWSDWGLGTVPELGSQHFG